MTAARDHERGDTLVEVMVAVAILGIAAVAIMAGLTLSASISGKDRGQSTSTTDVRNFAEYIESEVASGAFVSSGLYTWPGNSSVEVVQAECLSKASATTASPVWGSCPSDGGLQKLKLKATANGMVETLTIVVAKRCGVSDTC
ncbi:PulJ/GspJ family protein [Pimelobacter simplex]|uniref:PulJ/GspJ family protein n=1 Tax=Nocardioides simplex TaxID=2045 RepID=UPI001933DB56|nr:type II secretion system protein [Pimelobacter simplex]